MGENTVKNMLFKLGQTLVVQATTSSDAYCFAINVGHSDNDCGIHINPRFVTSDVVLNSCQDGTWQAEERSTVFPFRKGAQFKASITFTKEEFQVVVDDGDKITFANRQGCEEFNFLSFSGDITVTMISVQ